MSSHRDDPGPCHDDDDFLECLRAATGWTDNPPRLTKSLAPRLVTIAEDEGSTTETLATDSDILDDDEESEPELIVDLDLEEGWEKGPHPTAAQLADDFTDGGAGDSLEAGPGSADGRTFEPPRTGFASGSTRGGSWEEDSPPPPGRRPAGMSSSSSSSSSPRAGSGLGLGPIAALSQAAGPGRPLPLDGEAADGSQRSSGELQLAVSSPEFLVHNPGAAAAASTTSAGSPPSCQLRSVLLQTSACPALAARGRLLDARARDINAAPRGVTVGGNSNARDRGRDAGDAGIQSVGRPAGYVSASWSDRTVVRCRARDINVNSGGAGSTTGSRADPLPQSAPISVLDEALCFDPGAGINPRGSLAARKALSLSCLPAVHRYPPDGGRPPQGTFSISLASDSATRQLFADCLQAGPARSRLARPGGSESPSHGNRCSIIGMQEGPGRHQSAETNSGGDIAESCSSGPNDVGFLQENNGTGGETAPRPEFGKSSPGGESDDRESEQQTIPIGEAVEVPSAPDEEESASRPPSYRNETSASPVPREVTSSGSSAADAQTQTPVTGTIDPRPGDREVSTINPQTPGSSAMAASYDAFAKSTRPKVGEPSPGVSKKTSEKGSVSRKTGSGHEERPSKCVGGSREVASSLRSGRSTSKARPLARGSQARLRGSSRVASSIVATGEEAAGGGAPRDELTKLSIVLTGPFHIPRPPPLPRPPIIRGQGGAKSLSDDAQRGARPDGSQQRRNAKTSPDDADKEWPITEMSFIELDPTQPPGSDALAGQAPRRRQACIVLSPSEDEGELTVRRIRPQLVPAHHHQRPGPAVSPGRGYPPGRRVVPPIPKRNAAAVAAPSPTSSTSSSSRSSVVVVAPTQPIPISTVRPTECEVCRVTRLGARRPVVSNLAIGGAHGTADFTNDPDKLAKSEPTQPATASGLTRRPDDLGSRAVSTSDGLDWSRHASIDRQLPSVKSSDVPSQPQSISSQREPPGERAVLKPSLTVDFPSSFQRRHLIQESKQVATITTDSQSGRLDDDAGHPNTLSDRSVGTRWGQQPHGPAAASTHSFPERLHHVVTKPRPSVVSPLVPSRLQMPRRESDVHHRYTSSRARAVGRLPWYKGGGPALPKHTPRSVYDAYSRAGHQPVSMEARPHRRELPVSLSSVINRHKGKIKKWQRPK